MCIKSTIISISKKDVTVSRYLEAVSESRFIEYFINQDVVNIGKYNELFSVWLGHTASKSDLNVPVISNDGISYESMDGSVYSSFVPNHLMEVSDARLDTIGTVTAEVKINVSITGNMLNIINLRPQVRSLIELGLATKPTIFEDVDLMKIKSVRDDSDLIADDISAVDSLRLDKVIDGVNSALSTIRDKHNFRYRLAMGVHLDSVERVIYNGKFIESFDYTAERCVIGEQLIHHLENRTIDPVAIINYGFYMSSESGMLLTVHNNSAINVLTREIVQPDTPNVIDIDVSELPLTDGNFFKLLANVPNWLRVISPYKTNYDTILWAKHKRLWNPLFNK